MKLKVWFQEAVIKCGTWLFKKLIEHQRLEDIVVDKLIFEKKEEYLLEYIKKWPLSTYQITEILNGEENLLMIETLKNNVLNQEQQTVLVSKNNALLLERYLMPNGFFEIARRFKTIPEYMFIKGLAKSKKSAGYEVFKTYIDNTCRDVLSNELLEALLEMEESTLVHYIFYRVVLKKDQEMIFVKKADTNLIKTYISGHQLYSDSAQYQLLEKSFELAELHFQLYGLQSKAQQTYHKLRKEKIEQASEARGKLAP